jgi:hypothetical protein
MPEAPQHRLCAKCGDAPAGPGGVLCGPCRASLEQALEAHRPAVRQDDAS